MAKTISETIEFMKEQKQTLRAYCQSKMDADDWHAVSDAANDIREIDAVIRVLEVMRRKR
jgi:hypothetical protein